MTNLVKPRLELGLSKIKAFTKTLKVGRVSRQCTKKKVVLSSNILIPMGFNIGDSLHVRSLGKNKGLEFVPANIGLEQNKTVSVRSYKNRKSGTVQEAVIDERNQSRLMESIGQAESVRVVISKNRIQILPIEKGNNDGFVPLRAMAICSSGMDIVAAEKSGFKVTAVLDQRPFEKRDFKLSKSKDSNGLWNHNDKSETGFLTALANSENIQYVANEDIYLADWKLLNKLFNGQQFQTAFISLQCDDFTNAKGKKFKEISDQNLDSTLDMIFPAIEMIKEFNFPTVLFENAAEFLNTDAFKILRLQLRRIGYKLFAKKIRSSEQGGVSLRNRTFIFATKYDNEFVWPEETVKDFNFWDTLVAPFIGTMRCVSHTDSVKQAVAAGRARFITKDRQFGFSPMKSQLRQCKDSIYIEHEGEYYMPTLEQFKMMLSAEDFYTDHLNNEMAHEIIGQGVCMVTYEQITQQIKSHIQNAQYTENAIDEDTAEGRAVFSYTGALNEVKETLSKAADSVFPANFQQMLFN